MAGNQARAYVHKFYRDVPEGEVTSAGITIQADGEETSLKVPVPQLLSEKEAATEAYRRELAEVLVAVNGKRVLPFGDRCWLVRYGEGKEATVGECVDAAVSGEDAVERVSLDRLGSALQEICANVDRVRIEPPFPLGGR